MKKGEAISFGMISGEKELRKRIFLIIELNRNYLLSYFSEAESEILFYEIKRNYENCVSNVFFSYCKSSIFNHFTQYINYQLQNHRIYRYPSKRGLHKK